MAAGNSGVVKARKLLGVFALLILLLLSIGVVFTVPLAALPFEAALIGGGILAYRKSKAPVVRAIAGAAIAAGVVAFLTLAGIMLSLMPGRSSIFSSVSDSTPLPP